MDRNISDIAKDIFKNWAGLTETKPAYAYLQEMLEMHHRDNRTPVPTGESDYNIIIRFLSVSQTFRSFDSTANDLKNELRAIVGIPLVKKR